jgi:hypothetical protein
MWREMEGVYDTKRAEFTRMGDDEFALLYAKWMPQRAKRLNTWNEDVEAPGHGTLVKWIAFYTALHDEYAVRAMPTIMPELSNSGGGDEFVRKCLHYIYQEREGDGNAG